VQFDCLVPDWFNLSQRMSAFGGKADMAYCSANVRL
jgi:hypothetical protein